MDKVLNLQTLVFQYNIKENELYTIKHQIEKLRGTRPPSCFGNDDCSSQSLSTCPWSMDCGK
jgi:hypothetical protein